MQSFLATYAAEGGYVLATCQVNSCMLAGLMCVPQGTQQGCGQASLGTPSPPGLAAHCLPTAGTQQTFFPSLFCINFHHCSTSSDVTNMHGFSLLFPLRKVGEISVGSAVFQLQSGYFRNKPKNICSFQFVYVTETRSKR